MPTESLTNIVEGPVGKEALVIDAVAAAAIDLWSPVILAAAGSGEDLPRVTTTTTAHNVLIYGVAVGPKRTSGKAADAAGDLVQVCVSGRCKVKVDGNAAAIAIGDSLATHDAAGVAQKADFSSADNQVANINAAIKALASVFAVALVASTADGDVIVCFVRKVAGDTA